MENTTERYDTAFLMAMPTLAMVAPAGWFIASLLFVAGIGYLPGPLFWVGGPEGFIMTVTAPFFAATFIHLGRTVARAFPRTGVAVTVLGMLGVTTLSAIAAFRLFATVFVQHGIDEALMATAFNADSVLYLPFLVLQLGFFLAFIIGGVALLRMPQVPMWAGLALIAGIPTLVTGQFFLFHTAIFWPLATALWLAGMWGIRKVG
jgi:hypothetical protein